MFTGSAMCNSFLAELFQAVHNFSSNGDQFLLALFNNTATLNALTTGYTPALGGEISAAGYVAGGAAVPMLGVGSGGAVSFPQFLPVSWPVGPITAHGALLYNSTKGNRAVCVIDFGFDMTANPFTVTFPANGPSSAFVRVIGSPGAY